MPLYALTEGDTIIRISEIPNSWKIDDQWVSGFDVRPDLWGDAGWLPVMESRPEYDPLNEQLGTPTAAIEEEVIGPLPGGGTGVISPRRVVVSYPVEPIPPRLEPPERVVARVVATEQIMADAWDDATVAAVSDLFNPWRSGEAVIVGDLRSWDGTVVECIQAHTTQSDWTPDVVPALWKIHRASGAIAEWVQPLGAQDAYQIGDRVTHNGQTWESTAADNVWEPGVYGWVVV